METPGALPRKMPRFTKGCGQFQGVQRSLKPIPQTEFKLCFKALQVHFSDIDQALYSAPGPGEVLGTQREASVLELGVGVS